jgi:histidine ammonia-lyase
MATRVVEIGDEALTAEGYRAVAWESASVRLTDAARDRVARCAQVVREAARSGRSIYGVTTGFGSNRDTSIAPEQAERLQEKLVISHACGVGRPLPERVVRGMILLRVEALAQGFSGIRAETLERLVLLLNLGIHPVVPEQGSVGASGDLCPLAHMTLPLLGMGEVTVAGRTLPAAEALAAAGVEPWRLTYKEGLALLNGTQAMTALGLEALLRAERMLDVADAACALSLDAVGGRLEAFDPRIQAIRRRPGQVASAARVRALCVGSELAGSAPGEVEGKREFVQDAYCLRCAPQVHGAARDVLSHVLEVLLTEARAVTDNPLIFPDEGEILSGGNFHGQPVAMALDYLKIALTDLASISERRTARLVDRAANEGLPAFLVRNPGLNSGYMIPQYVAAALVAECKTLAVPASVDTIPTSANMEDHVSFGHHAGRQALRILEQLEQVLAIELMVAAQAVDLRAPRRPGHGNAFVHAQIRAVVPFLEEDRYLAPELASMLELVRERLRIPELAQP